MKQKYVIIGDNMIQTVDTKFVGDKHCDAVENKNWDNPCMEKATVKITLKEDSEINEIYFCKKHYEEFKHQVFVFR